MKKKITIIGGGPAGLFCADQLLKRGFEVNLYDQMSGTGKKFLVAGNGGLNLTHSENLDDFSKHYGKNELFFKKLLEDFSPCDLRSWCDEMNVPTFVGTSGRVFPEKLNAAEILLKWTRNLKLNPRFNLFLKHRLTGVTKDKELSFEVDNKKLLVQAEVIIFALGGASWAKTGSDGKWKEIFESLDIEFRPFLPMNCGFERDWSEYFIRKIDRSPLKNVLLEIGDRKIRGEIMLTPYGIEGGGVYAISDLIRDEILTSGQATITIDLKPDLSKKEILKKLKSKKKKDSLSNHLRKSLHFDKMVLTLLHELTSFDDIEALSVNIKNLKMLLTGIRPIDEAISTGGGLAFCSLSSNLEIKGMPEIYAVGEMLDFEAPTGGYLLQGCFSTAWRVVEYIDKRLSDFR